MARLVITTPSGGVPHELTEKITTIGRAPENVMQLEDPSVSGRHAQIEQVGEDYTITDLESTNGTRVNGELVTSVTLRVGDRIRFGKVEACYECDVPEEAQPLPVLQQAEARPAEVSAKPVDFANASPFPRRRTENDPVRLAAFAAAGLALLAFIASMLSLAQMRAPLP
jgi:pSer/pThr/pTyr-binding forkhead associated (FHA) protein